LEGEAFSEERGALRLVSHFADAPVEHGQHLVVGVGGFDRVESLQGTQEHTLGKLGFAQTCQDASLYGLESSAKKDLFLG